MYLISTFELFDPFFFAEFGMNVGYQSSVFLVKSNVTVAWNCEMGMTPTPYEASEMVFVGIFEKKKMQLSYSRFVAFEITTW